MSIKNQQCCQIWKDEYIRCSIGCQNLIGCNVFKVIGLRWPEWEVQVGVVVRCFDLFLLGKVHWGKLDGGGWRWKIHWDCIEEQNS